MRTKLGRMTLGVSAMVLVGTLLATGGGAQDGTIAPGAGYYPPYFPPYAGQRHASTAGEGHARGLASIIRSIGEANLLNSAAAKNLTEAQSKYLENRLDATQTYFEMRAINKAYRQEMRGPRPSSEQLFRYAAERAPDRLTPQQLDPVTGELQWPVILRDEMYASELQQLADLFALRAERQYLDSEAHLSIQDAGNQLLEKLKANLELYPPMDYVEARKFIVSLMYEARFPPG